MRKIFVLAVMGIFLFTGLVYADGPRRNASPVSVELDATTTYQEIPFEYETRDLYIHNYDSQSGIWVNFRGSDTSGVVYGQGGNKYRYYIGPNTEETFYDFMTTAITVILDNTYTQGMSASPVTVIATF